MVECIFCKIVQGEIPAAKVYEDDEVLAFLDINPILAGHTLVIPKVHCETLADAAPSVLEACMRAVKKVGCAVMDAMAAEGLNVLQNNFEVAGQEIDHLHFHLIPRFRNDGFRVPWPAKPYPDGELERVQEKIRGAL